MTGVLVPIVLAGSGRRCLLCADMEPAIKGFVRMRSARPIPTGTRERKLASIRLGAGSTEIQVEPMAREVRIGSRKFWVVSEPYDAGWKAQVLEVLDEGGGTKDAGI